MSFQLPLFPEGSLASSVVTTVWIGVFVTAMFNLRLGWTFSGLVIPGYLVPLMMIKPLAALIVCLEGVLTYLIVYVVFQRGAALGRWSNVFGRDRFFALVLTSICIRVVFDGYLLPELSRLAMDAWRIEYDFVNNLHSYGLIIVSLIANQFWKPGLVRGVVPLITTVGITYLIVRYPLMHWTNFSVGSFEYMYEDLASSVLASPKAYIILVLTSFVASRLNLYYSWDFNGILIPSLIAIQWYEPLKVLTSFVEAGFVFLVGARILRMNAFKESTIEGARKVLLFFNVSFAYKLLLGHTLGRIFPDLQVTDCFGFGYLLPSLLAVKMHDKGIAVRITRTTLQASIMGVAAASLLGFSLTLLPEVLGRATADASAPPRAAVLVDPRPLPDCLRADKVSLYQRKTAEKGRQPRQFETDAFTTGLRTLRSYLSSRLQGDLESAAASLSIANYRLARVEGRYCYLSEYPPGNGWGTYIVDERAERDLVIEVPAPLDEWATLECGALFLSTYGARALAVSTSGGDGDGAEAPVVLRARRTFFDWFHRVFNQGDVLQVRAHEAASMKALDGVEVARGSLETPDVPSSLWVKERLASSLGLRTLEGLVNGVRIEWRVPALRNVLRESSAAGFCELFLTRRDRRSLLARWLVGTDGAAAAQPADVASGPAAGQALGAWLTGLTPLLGQRGTNSYVRPSAEQLLYLDEEVLRPLWSLTQSFPRRELSAPDVGREISAVRSAARALGYELSRHAQPDAELLILHEGASGGLRRHWGIYVFRLGSHQRFAIEIPHPIYEESTVEYGAALFQRLEAAALLLAGSHPKCNTDGSADVVMFENRASLFNLASQVILRDGGDAPLAAVQVRAFGLRPGTHPLDVDALIAWSDASLSRATLSPQGRILMAVLDSEGMVTRFVDGGQETSGYDVQGCTQALYLPHTRNKELIGVWLSPFVRWGYGQADDRTLQDAQIQALGIATVEASLADQLPRARPGGAPPEALLRSLRQYAVTRDINALHLVVKDWPSLRLERLIDRGSKRSFLLVWREGHLVPVVLALAVPGSGSAAPPETDLGRALTPDDVARFLRSGGTLLRWSPP